VSPPRAHLLRQELWNLPNLLTLARVAVIPLFVLYTYYADPLHSFLAAMIFTGAAVSDLLDGYLARKMHLETVLGKFLDPLADKLIVMAALVMLTRLGRVASGIVIVILAREFTISGLRAIAMSEGLVIVASQGGKWKTSLQVTGIVGLLIHYTHQIGFLGSTYLVDFGTAGTWLLYLSLIPSLSSAVGYFRSFWTSLPQRAPLPGSPQADMAKQADRG